MRYLKEREEFIKNNRFSNLQLIKEADSGPLANDIPWGDSLVGRLINSIIRKVKIGADLVRIDSVINKLKETFDSIIADAKITGAGLSKEILIKLDMIKISTLLGELKAEVEKGSEKKKIIELTKSTIQSITNLAVQPESDKVKKEVIDKLNEFLKSIESKEEEKPKDDGISKLYPKMLENFTSVYNILCQYDKMKKNIASTIPQKVEKEKEKVPVTTGGTASNAPTINDLSEGFIYESIDTTLLKSIKPLYDYSKQFFEFPEDENRKKDEFFNLIGNQQNKAPLIKIYSYIKRKSVNESLVNLLTKPENMGAKILTLYQITKSKENGDFSGIDEKMKGEIVKFNASMKDILTPTQESPKIETPKNENSLFRYSEFRLIKEADEETPKVEPKEGEGKTTDPTKEVKKESDIKLHWTRIFDPEFMKKWIITEEESRRVNEEVEKLTKDSTKITINGIDPIVEIVQIFNRAYKLHTVENIPSGRTGERVSSMTKRDYIYMGKEATPTGADAGGKGPWRVKSIWNKWEEAVLNIIKDSKYQVLFNEDTIVKVGKADPRINVSVKKDKDGNAVGTKKQGGGKTLLTFINSMLDGSDLYKNGAQSAFIKEYFDVEVDDNRLGSPGKTKGGDSIPDLVDPNKEKKKKKYSFKILEKIDPKSTRTFYTLLTSSGQKYYFMVMKEEGDYIYVKYSKTFYHFNQCLNKIAVVDKGELDSIEERKQDKDQVLYPVSYARINKGEFKVGDMKFISINISKYNKDETVKPSVLDIKGISKIYGLSDDGSKLLKLPSDKQSSSGDPSDGKDYGKYKDKVDEFAKTV